MAITWTEDLAVGIEEIDNQHKELFARADRLLLACRTGRGKEEVSGLLDFLARYVVEHFGAEEELQRRYQFPEYPRHHASHEDFVAQLRDLQAAFEKEGPTLPFLMRVNRVVVGWLIHHIGRSDRELAQYLRTHGYPGAAA